MNRAKTNPRTQEERIDALRLGIENALGLIEHVDAGAACVELRARLRTDEEAAASPVSLGVPTPAMIKRGERLILTGYDDVLHARLEPFLVDGARPTQSVERRMTWALLEAAVIDVLPEVIVGLRAALTAPEPEP